MDTFTTKPGSVTGSYTDSIELSGAGPISTDGVVIDARGDIAGTYQDSTGEHAFLTSAATGTTTSFDGAAGAQQTSVVGIDAASDVFGTSYVYGNGLVPYYSQNMHGYVYRDGAATVVEPTGASSSSILAVNAAGTVGGFYYDAQGNQHAFVGTPGNLDTFDIPNSTDTTPRVIDATGDVAGTAYATSGYTYNRVIFFKPQGGTAVAATLPDGYYAAQVTGVNSAGEVVGTYQSTNGGSTVGFTYTQTGGFNRVALPTAGSTVVSVAGLDALGDVAGTYTDAAGKRHGFIDGPLEGSTAIDGPAGATATEVTSIDAAGTVFGDYTDAAGQQHAFFQRLGGTFTAVPDVPGALQSAATGEDAAGDVVGSYYTYGNNGGYGDPSFIDRAGTTTQITVPGRPEVYISSVDVAGRLIGTVSDADGTHGLIDDNGRFTTFDGAAGAQATTPIGTDAAGDIAGNYVDAKGVSHGFLRQGTTVATIDPAGATSTTVSAINAAGVVAGTYYGGKATHGFVDVGGTISTFDSPGGTSSNVQIEGIDAKGDVLAEFGGSRNSYLRDAATGTLTKVAVAGALSTSAQGIDAAGDVFGSFQDANGQHGFVQTAGGATTTVDGPAGAIGTTVYAVDAAGDAFGTYQDRNENAYLFEQKVGATSVTTFALPSGIRAPSIVGVDAAGDVAANGYTYDATNRYRSFGLVEVGGTVTQVTGSADATQTGITGIDAAGDIFGSYQNTAGQHAFASFAAEMPTIAGTHASATFGEAMVSPFSGVTVGGSQNRTASLTIALSGAGGTLRDGVGYGGLARNADGSYALSGTAAAVTAELNALAFTPAAQGTTTFTLTDTSGIGGLATGTVTDAKSVVTDTAAVVTPVITPASTSTPTPASTPAPTSASTPAPTSALTPTATPVAPDAVAVSQQVSYRNGVFTLSGTASSVAGVRSVEITAQVDGVSTDLGSAAVAADGTWTFSDRIGRHTQGFITATETNGAGGTASALAGYALTGGRGGAYRAEQDRYSADGSAVTATDLFKANGSQKADLFAPGGETFASSFFDTFDNAGAPFSTFVFDPGHGLDLVNQFRVGGTDHDTLSFKGADFSNDIAAVLQNAHNTKGGVVILDPTSGDTVRLSGITKAQLAHNQGDIAFHA